MSANAVETVSFKSWFREKMFLGMTFREYFKSLITPFNIIAALILCVGIPVAVIRFTQGLQASTNLSNDYPWGLWIGFDVMGGVALAAGGFVITATGDPWNMSFHLTPVVARFTVPDHAL